MAFSRQSLNVVTDAVLAMQALAALRDQTVLSVKDAPDDVILDPATITQIKQDMRQKFNNLMTRVQSEVVTWTPI